MTEVGAEAVELIGKAQLTEKKSGNPRLFDVKFKSIRRPSGGVKILHLV